MFGLNDDQKQADEDVMAVTAPDDAVTSDAPADPMANSSPAPNDNSMMDAAAPGAPTAPSEPQADLTTPELPSSGTPDNYIETPVNGSTSGVGNVDSDLLNIKQQALTQLSPLVGQLDQTPEEKFRTTMMMIQASDDQKMIPDAFEAAKQIKDDKARAQALLDVINEINYFTQPHQQD